jgi:16S rRNA (uracil1498-N3)-methyltransferase
VRRRFFVQQFVENRAVIEGETAHHLGRVLRAQEGQLYELSDGRRVWLGRIEQATRDRIQFSLLEEIPVPEAHLHSTLLLSVVKFEAFEWAIEKATELGASTIVPLAAARSEKALLAAARKRSERWKKILVESSQQSRRVSVPMLEEVTHPAAAFAKAVGLKLMLCEGTAAPRMRSVLADAAAEKRVVLAIGPEGGWTDGEFRAAQTAGFREASLGQLILRTETAAAAALAVLNFALSQ